MFNVCLSGETSIAAASFWKAAAQVSLSGRATVLDAVETAVEKYGGLGFILEKGRVRVLRREEAIRFWRDWGSSQEGRK